MIPTPGNCSSFVTVSHCLNSAPLDVEMLIDNYRHTTVKMTMKTISVHLICQSKVAENLFIRLHPTFFCRVMVCAPERFRISGNAWVSPTRPSSTLGNVYCKLAGPVVGDVKVCKFLVVAVGCSFIIEGCGCVCGGFVAKPMVMATWRPAARARQAAWQRGSLGWRG